MGEKITPEEPFSLSPPNLKRWKVYDIYRALVETSTQENEGLMTTGSPKITLFEKKHGK